MTAVRAIISSTAGFFMGMYLTGILFPVHYRGSIWLLWGIFAICVLASTKAVHWVIGAAGQIARRAYIRLTQTQTD